MLKIQNLKSEEVFKPGAFPNHTYVSREFESPNISYELRLRQALKISGCLTSIVGPSKMGKTILCEKVIGFDNIVEVSGADFYDDRNFWEVIAAKAELPYAGEFTKGKKLLGGSSEEQYKKLEKYTLTKDKVIESYREKGKVLVLDDFHYANKDMQLKIAQQLKDAIRREFKAVVVSLPHRADDAIRQNADLSGRLSLINIDTWKRDELKEIAIKGFKELHMEITEDIANKIAIESLTSPQLMQYICLSICTLLEDREEMVYCVEEDILETAYRFTTVNFEYKNVVDVMCKGPNPRGKKRKIFRTADGEEMDLYALIVESLAKNPPIMELDFDLIKERIDGLIQNGGEKPDKQAVKDHLGKLQSILAEREDIYRVLEWKDGKVYILDPLFLFYLRWGRR